MAKAVTGYTRTQIFLHWTIAALFIFQIVAHEGIEQAMQAIERGEQVSQFNPHVVVGLLVLALVIWRLVLRRTRGAPEAPQEEHVLLRWLSVGTHLAFYALLFVLPFSGSAMWFFGAGPAHTVHELAKNLLILLVLLHVIGALTHHFVFKTNVLRRMVGRA